MAIRFPIIITATVMLIISATGCAGESEIPSPAEPVKHLTVNGKPFLMLGAQLRTDFFRQLDGKTAEELDPYFSLAAQMNITVVQVPVGWRDIEPQKDQYSNEWVVKLIELCGRHNLKLEILWFGSNMCGYSVEGYIPDYVVYNQSVYPRLNFTAYQGWLGLHFFLKPNTPTLLEREEKAIGKMMDFIEKYDNTHGKKHVVIGVQIENEPDMLATRHNSLHGLKQEQLWPDIVKQVDRLGQVVKNSAYKCYTRVNLVLDTDYLQRCKDVAATSGIDYVGLDPYQNRIADIEEKLQQLKSIGGNYAHIAENGGEFENNDLLTLKALTMGCGYEIFEVITTPHPDLADWTLRGVWNPDFTPKPHTQRIVDAFKIYKNAWVDLASAETVDILGFNLKQDNGQEQTSESQQTTHVSVNWSTTSRGVAFAVEHDGHITVASTKNDVMQFGNRTLTKAEKGYYDMSGHWVKEGNVTLNENILNMEPLTVYRLPIIN